MDLEKMLAQVWLSRVAMKRSLRRELRGNPLSILVEYERDPRGISLQEIESNLCVYLKQGIRVLLPTDNLYQRVFGAYQSLGFDVPFLLYVKGNVGLLEKVGIAFVGSRRAAPYARRVTQELVAGLKGLDVAIVSGGAAGVDTEAHKAALAGNLATICVLGCGIGYDYPAANAELFARIGREHLLISEYPPGTAPRPYQFPERNRIIAQASSAVVVTSAGESSGSLITAECAMELNHPVLSVPWPLFEPLGEGCNFLLEAGSPMITSGSHLRDFLTACGLIDSGD